MRSTRRRRRAYRPLPVQPATAKDTQIGLFIQDDWTPNDHLTVNHGIRWDYETNAKNENFVTPPAIAAALARLSAVAGSGDQPRRLYLERSLTAIRSARLPAAARHIYDVNGDRDLVFFAGAGRYYDRPLFIDSGLETIKDVYQSVPPINFCNPTGGTYAQLTPCAAPYWQFDATSVIRHR